MVRFNTQKAMVIPRYLRVIRQALLFTVVLIILALTHPVWPQNLPNADSDEYQVYEAALGLMDHIPKAEPRVTIYDATLNSKCGDDAYPAPLANGCTFLWVSPQTEKDVKILLRDAWPDMDDSA